MPFGPLGLPKQTFFGTSFALTDGVHGMLEELMHIRGQTATEVAIAALSLSKALTKAREHGKILVVYQGPDFYSSASRPSEHGCLTVPDDFGVNHRSQSCDHRLVMEMTQSQLNELNSLSRSFGGARDFFLWRGIMVLAAIETERVVSESEYGKQLIAAMRGGAHLRMLHLGWFSSVDDLEPFDYKRAIAKNRIDARQSQRAPELE